MQEPWHYPFNGQKDGGYYPPDGQKGPAKHPVKMGTLTSPQGSTRQSKACYCHGFTALQESAANAHTPNNWRRQTQQPSRLTQSQAKISFHISLTKLKLVYEGLLTVYMPTQPVNSSVLLYLGANGVRQKERAQTVLNYFCVHHFLGGQTPFYTAHARLIIMSYFHFKPGISKMTAVKNLGLSRQIRDSCQLCYNLVTTNTATKDCIILFTFFFNIVFSDFSMPILVQ